MAVSKRQLQSRLLSNSGSKYSSPHLCEWLDGGCVSIMSIIPSQTQWSNYKPLHVREPSVQRRYGLFVWSNINSLSYVHRSRSTHAYVSLVNIDSYQQPQGFTWNYEHNDELIFSPWKKNTSKLKIAKLPSNWYQKAKPSIHYYIWALDMNVEAEKTS